MILELCKGVHCVDLVKSFPTRIYLQNFASIQPRTSPEKCVVVSFPRFKARPKSGLIASLPRLGVPREEGKVVVHVVYTS